MNSGLVKSIVAHLNDWTWVAVEYRVWVIILATVIGLADTACGYACFAHLPQTGRNFTTIELKSNFLGTCTEGTIRAVAKGVHLGRTTQVWDATVFAPDGKTIALFRCTQMVLY